MSENTKWKVRRDWLSFMLIVLLISAMSASLAQRDTLSEWLLIAAVVSGIASLACWWQVGWRKTLFPDEDRVAQPPGHTNGGTQ